MFSACAPPICRHGSARRQIEAADVADFYADPVKVQCESESLQKALWLRRVSTGTSLGLRSWRGARFVAQSGLGRMRDLKASWTSAWQRHRPTVLRGARFQRAFCGLDGKAATQTLSAAMITFAVLTFPNIDPVLFSIGPFAVRWYALAYIVGLLFGIWYMKRLVSNPKLWAGTTPSATPQQIDDLFLWAMLGVVLGGRIGYLLFYGWTQMLS